MITGIDFKSPLNLFYILAILRLSHCHVPPRTNPPAYVAASHARPIISALVIVFSGCIVNQMLSNSILLCVHFW